MEGTKKKIYGEKKKKNTINSSSDLSLVILYIFKNTIKKYSMNINKKLKFVI